MKLKEFIDKNGNQVKIPKSSNAPKNTGNNLPLIGSFKERFKGLIEYTSKHKNPNTKSITTETLTEDKLEFTEEYYDGSSVSYEIYIGPLTEAWSFKVYTDGDFSHPIDDMSGMEWVNLLKELRYYIVLPVVGTPEYKDILQESFLKEFVDAKGNKVNLPKSTSSKATGNIPDQTDRYKLLVAQIESDGVCKCRVTALTNTTLVLVTEKKVVIRIDRIRSSHPYILKIGNREEAYADYDELLEVLIDEGIIANTDLCESASTSIADDFKTYENLWD